MKTYRFTPTNRTATTLEEFVSVCRQEPDVAFQHLVAGYFEPWLRDTGRSDLAQVVRKMRSARKVDFSQFLTAARATRSVPRAARTIAAVPTRARRASAA